MATANILEPTAAGSINDGYVITGGGNVTNSVNDSSDSTYIRKPASNTTYDVFWNITDAPTIDVTSVIPWRIQVLARESQSTGGNVALRVLRPSYLGRGWSYAEVNLRSKQVTGTVAVSGSATATPVPTASITGDYIEVSRLFDDVPRALADATGSTALSVRQTILNQLQIGFRDASTSASRGTLYAIWASLETTTRPTASALIIDGDTSAYNVNTTSRPVVEWTYGQTDSIAQSAYEVAVFSATTADMTSSTNRLWTSGVISSTTARSATIEYDLINGQTYYIYVRVAMALGSITYWSAQVGSGAVSVTLTAPSQASLTVAWTSASQRADLSVSGSVYAAGTQVFTIQRSDDGGTTWATVRDAGAITPNATPSTAVTVYDYECPRTGTVKYRAQAVGTVSGQVVSGAYSTERTITQVSDNKHWLKAPETSSLNVGNLAITADPEYQVEEQTTTLRPLGRESAVVVSGALGGDDGAFDIEADSSNWTAVKAIITAQQTLLWQDPFLEQRYIRITSRSWTRYGDRSAPRYRANCSFVEVSSP